VSAPAPPGDDQADGRITISPEELARVVEPGDPREAPARLSHLAVASFVLALIGVPLVGFVLGPIAVGAGLLAISAFQGRRRPLRGFALAVAGVVLGSVDVVGWVIGLAIVLGRPQPAPVLPLLPAWSSRAIAGIEEAPPVIRRALHANLFVRCRSSAGESTGSAVVVRRDDDTIYALTNRHVVNCGERGRTLGAATLGGKERTATVLWTAPDGVDAALLSVPAARRDEPDAVAVSPGDAPRVGDAVFAIGNPLGFEATYTAGVLSAIRALNETRAIRVLQVQASVSPGHSGGGLYDGRGALVGINTWTAPRTSAEGMGFALSARDLFALIDASGWPLAPAPKGKESP
jgi:S1-C subfamily serine protease